MAARVDGIIRFGDFPLFINEVTNPARVAGLGVIAGAISEAEAPLGVAQERKRKIIFARKRGVLVYRVKTDPENLNITGAELVYVVAKPAAFRRSAGRVGLWVEPQEHFLALQFRER